MPEDGEPRLGRDFTRLLVGAAASNLGDGVRLAALPLLAVALTDDPRLISGLLAATYLPMVVFGPIAGAIVDRDPRRRLLVIGQAGRGLAAASFTVAILTDTDSIAAVYVLAIVLGLGEVVVDGAAQAAVPQVSPPSLLERANARLIRAQLVLDEMAGTALGGLLFSLATPLPFAVDTISFFTGAVMMGRIDDPLAPSIDDQADETSLGDRIRDGFAYLRADPFSRGIAVSLAIQNLGAAMGGSVLVLLVVDELGAPEASFGLVLSAGALGGFVGSIAAERLVAAVGRGTVMLGAVLCEAVATLALAFSPSVLAAAATQAAISFIVVNYNIPTRAAIQSSVPNNLLGRVLITVRTVAFIGVPVGAVLAGGIAHVLDVRAVYVAAATLIMVAAYPTARAAAHGRA